VKIHDKYILGGFWRNLAIGLIAFTVIYVTVDLSEQIDDYIDNHARILDVALYYALKIPWILVLIMPVSVLLATIFSLGKLSRENELTAFICSGTPLVRIAAPIIVSAFALSLVMMASGEFLIAKTNRESLKVLRVKIKKEERAEPSRYRENVHYQGEKGRTYYAERYDTMLKALTNVALYEYRGASLTRRIDAQKAYWDGAEWVFTNGAVREFSDGVEKVTPFAKLSLPDLPERPEDFAKEDLDPEEMNYRELSAYVAKVARSGGPVDKYRVDLYFKLSFPFTNLIFAMIGAALSSAKRKPSMATGFGLTLFISFAYYGVLRIGQALGHSGVIAPLFGAWMGNIAFVFIGGLLLHRANR
jgi:lipopolysaccharide export system permease protein